MSRWGRRESCPVWSTSTAAGSALPTRATSTRTSWITAWAQGARWYLCTTAPANRPLSRRPLRIAATQCGSSGNTAAGWGSVGTASRWEATAPGETWPRPVPSGARDTGEVRLCFQLLVYPVTDARMQTLSIRQFTDSPCWNARLNRRMWRLYLRDGWGSRRAYASPMEADSFAGLPDAYVEVEQFDCLRDEGIAYAAVLAAAGARVAAGKGGRHLPRFRFLPGFAGGPGADRTPRRCAAQGLWGAFGQKGLTSPAGRYSITMDRSRSGLEQKSTPALCRLRMKKQMR